MYKRPSISEDRNRILNAAFFRAANDERGLSKAFQTQAQYRLTLRMGILNRLSVERMATLTDFWPDQFTSTQGYKALDNKLGTMRLEIEKLNDGTPLIIFNAEDLTIPNVLRFPIVRRG